MKKLFRLGFLTFVLALVLNTGVFAATTVNLIATNDMHGVLLGSDTCIGIDQVSAIKNSTPNAILVDSGDATQGTSLATINKGNDIIKLMNATGYDVMVAGNHEFDFGSEQLAENAETAKFPILSANCNSTNGTLLPGTTIITEAGKKIGFVGITTTITNTATNPALRPGVTFGNEITAAKSAIASLKGQVDTIVLLTHLGDDPSAVPVTSQDLLDGLSNEELAQVSAVLDGHSHTIESEPYTRGNYSIPVIQDQTQLTHVGKVAITFNDNNTVSATEEVMDYDTAGKYPLTSTGESAKEATQTAIDEITQEQSTITSRQIGQTSTPLWGGYIYWDYAEPRIVETSFGDMVSDAFRDAAQTYVNQNNISGEVLGMVNGGGLSATINPGNITYGNILDAFNHGNMTVVLQTTPAEVYKVLEAGLKTTGQDSQGMLERESVSGSFIQCSGFSYSYDPAGAEGNKVTSVVTNSGTQLSRNDTTTPIIIGTQNYVETFFENTEELVMLGGEDSVISDFISSQNGPLNYPVNRNRITISNDKSPDSYSVTIPVYTEGDTLAPAGATLHLSIDNGSYRVVTLDDNSNLNVSLSKGPHTLMVSESTTPVYVNNYSGSGTNYTKPGYYGLSFTVGELEDYIPATSLTLNTDSVDLSPQYGSNTATLTATVTPANSTDQVEWTISNDTVASIIPDGNTCTVSGNTDGIALITVSCGTIEKTVDVIVSDNPIVASNYTITNQSPDSFTVLVEDVHSNRDISNNVNVEQVSIFTWSDDFFQTDMDCKIAEQVPGTDNYQYTFPINDNAVNNYYFNPDQIKIHIYASSEKGNNGNMIGVYSYNYNNLSAMNTNAAVTTYCSNIGFVKPSAGNGVIAGAPGLAQPIEGIRIGSPYTSLNNLTICYTVHVQDLGWQPSTYDGSYCGTMHLNKPIEAVQISLVGEDADQFKLTYQTTAADGTVSPVCSDNEIAGSTGHALPLTGLKVTIEQVN